VARNTKPGIKHDGGARQPQKNERKIFLCAAEDVELYNMGLREMTDRHVQSRYRKEISREWERGYTNLSTTRGYGNRKGMEGAYQTSSVGVINICPT
jgi:hypothetical protein